MARWCRSCAQPPPPAGVRRGVVALQALLLAVRVAVAAAAAPDDPPVTGMDAPLPIGVYTGQLLSSFGSASRVDPASNLTCLPDGLVIAQDLSITVSAAAITFGPTRVGSATAPDGTVFFREGSLSQMFRIDGMTDGVLSTRNPSGQTFCRYAAVSFNATSAADGSPPSTDTPVALSLVTLGGSEWSDPAELCSPTMYTSTLAGLQPEFTTLPYCGGPGRVPTRSSVVAVLEREPAPPPPTPPSPRPSHSVTPTPQPLSPTPAPPVVPGGPPPALVGEWSGGLAVTAGTVGSGLSRCMPDRERTALVLPGFLDVGARGNVTLRLSRPPPSRIPPGVTLDPTRVAWWVDGDGPWTLPPPWSNLLPDDGGTWEGLEVGLRADGEWNATSHILTLRASSRGGPGGDAAAAGWLFLPVPASDGSQPADGPAPVGTALTVLVGGYVNGSGSGEDDARAEAWVQQSGWLLARRMNGSTTLPTAPPLPCPVPAPFVPGGQPLAGRMLAARWDVVGGGGGEVRPAGSGVQAVGVEPVALAAAMGIAAVAVTARGVLGWGGGHGV